MGDLKGGGGGVMELRIDYGPGYRIYYAKEQDHIIILLGGVVSVINLKILPMQSSDGTPIRNGGSGLWH